MTDIDPCSRCSECGHSRWMHQLASSSNVYRPYGREQFTCEGGIIHKEPAGCGKEGCACRQFNPVKKDAK